MDDILYIEFTFYCSSIKGVEKLIKQTAELEFTFYCSSIKGHSAERSAIPVTDLHSTVVLLKVCKVWRKEEKIKEFTFYCSSIKGIARLNSIAMKQVFTFYCSSIKGHSRSLSLCRQHQFTFYCSSIKGLTCIDSMVVPVLIYILL